MKTEPKKQTPELSKKSDRMLPVLLLLILSTSYFVSAATTINPVNKYAYGANLGWVNAYADGANGAVIGEYVCSGHLYAANVGWIKLGSGSPANGIQYQNNSTTDYGVNHDGLGNLRGYAYGANIGWINFESTGGAKVDLLTGKLSGHAWSANCGWISLSNTFAHVQTDTIAPGADSDGDGIADAWELTYTNALSAFTATTDTDGDGVPDAQEYLADTSPLDPSDLLLITSAAFAPEGTNANFTWLSKPTRFYHLEKTSDLAMPTWLDSGLGLIAPDGATTARAFNDTNAPTRFYRVEAVRPLGP